MRKRGFTLVELLVVIAIIGILIALLLPAVQAAREAARRMECTNKIKQLALASHNYHDVNGTLPAGASPNQKNGTSAGSNHRRVGWGVSILPYIEQQALYDHIIAMGMPVPWTTDETVGQPLYEYNVPALLCPSDSQSLFIESQWGRCSYRGCAGDSWVTAVYYEASNLRGIFGFSKLGTTWFPLSAVLDGTSNTILFSEGGIGKWEKATDTLLIRRAIAMSSSHGDPTGTSGKPRDCINRRGPNGTITGVADSGQTGTPYSQPVLGRGFQDGMTSATGFATILPPNSPSCVTSADFSGLGGTHNPLISANSFHKGGVNCAFVDGSVRFIGDTIDCETVPDNTTASGLDLKPATMGPSHYGIWGALGSKEGGESSTL